MSEEFDLNVLPKPDPIKAIKLIVNGAKFINYTILALDSAVKMADSLLLNQTDEGIEEVIKKLEEILNE